MSLRQGSWIIDGQDIPNGYQQITTLTTSTTLTVPADTRCCVMIPETQAVRFRDDGTAPTASVGMPLATGTYFIYTGDPRSLKIIEQVVGATLNILYYK
jgi:hypothetical protein